MESGGASGVPQAPTDPEQRNIIDKLAQFVARNGPDFEVTTKSRQKGNPKFQFLFGGEFYHYYTYKVNAEQAAMRQQQQQQGQGPQGYGWPNQQQQSWGGGAYQQPTQHQPGGYQGHYNNSPSGQAQQASGGGGGAGGRPPRPLMDIPTYMPPHGQGQQPSVNIQELRDGIDGMKKQRETLRKQITESESNLAAQQTVTHDQTKLLSAEAIRKARWEHLELLANDTGLDLEEVETVFQPIIESCTKDSISGGKGWIFNKATSHDNNKLIAHYLSYRVTQESAAFTVKLHLVYLMNDVLHHCVRKGAEELKQSLESVAVEMFSAGWTAAGAEEAKQAKFTKLVKLWDDKSIFSQSTIAKMKEPDVSFKTYLDQLKITYATEISAATKDAVSTYDNYALQHQAFVNHAEKTIVSLDGQIKESETKIEDAEKQQKAMAAAAAAAAAASAAATGTTPESEPKRTTKSSRWDTTSHPSQQQQQQQPPGEWGQQPRPPMGMPDLSRPPPGFPPPGMAPGMGGPHGGFGGHPSQQQFDEKALIPTLPYFDLPAGLMVPLIKMEDSGYKPINPKDIRLPPPIPPTERLLAAIDAFYAPPSHERPRDPGGFEMLGLYEWSKDKTAAIRAKADDLEAGRRDRSPTASPDPYGSDSDGAGDGGHGAPATTAGKGTRWEREAAAASKKREPTPPKEPEKKKKRYRSLSRTPPPRGEDETEKRRSRSRTRSRSRGSTPDPANRGRGGRQRARSGGSSSPSPPRGGRDLHRRSPTPEESGYAGLGSAMAQSAPATRLDASNKGHQMLQKMGWSGSGGLGSKETGIAEPISGGEVREKNDMYRGVGSNVDAFEAFRKQQAHTLYNRMKDRGVGDKPKK